MRLVLGGNEELAGAVPGPPVRWILLTDTTVTVEGLATPIVTNGVLTIR